MGEIGKRIRDARIKKGWSQQDLAEEAKISIKTIQRIENNKSEAKEKTLRLIYDALEIEVVKLDSKPLSRYQVLSMTLAVIVIAGTFLTGSISSDTLIKASGYIGNITVGTDILSLTITTFKIGC